MAVKAVALLVLVVTACGPSEWTKASADTTCEDWLTRMTEEQQREMVGPLFYNTVVEELGADPELVTEEFFTDEALDVYRDVVTDTCEEGPSAMTVPSALSQALRTRVEQIFEDVSDALSD